MLICFLSVSALLAYSNISITFHANTFLMQDLNHLKIIGKGELIQGLYVVKSHPATLPVSATVSQSSTEKSILCSFCNSVSNNASLDLWHARLGHLSSKCLQLLAKELGISNAHSTHSCTICPLSKQKRLPFQSHV